MKRLLCTLYVVALALCAVAQETTEETAPTAAQTAIDRLNAWNTEVMLDSLDQEKLPKIVSGGLLAGMDVSNFLITRAHHTMSSHMRIGAELGGFMDFRLGKNFAIQPQLIFTAQQNNFKEENDTTNHLWSFGVDIPIYFLGRFGNMKQGYINFGGGMFTHFTFASNKGKYKAVDPSTITPSGDGYDYSRLYTLHNNHFGVCAMIGYEFGFGMQINVQYKISLSDIAGFYNEMKGQEIADALIYPHTLSIHIGYRWR